MPINRILFQNLRDGYNTNGRSKRLENITKEITTVEANLEIFIELIKHVRSNHNKKLTEPDTEIKKNENNCRDDIIALKLDNATEEALLSDIRKPIFHWKSQNEASNSIHSSPDEWFIKYFWSSSSACCFLPFALGSKSPKFLVVHLPLFPLSSRC